MKKTVKKLKPYFFALSSILFFLAFLLGIFLSINIQRNNLDNRNEAAGKTHFIDPSFDLQNIINNAGPSDAIYFKPGEYRFEGNSINIINKKIRLLGSGESYTIIASNKQYPILNIENSEVYIESLTVSGSQLEGIKVIGLSKLTLRDVKVTKNATAGIRFEGSDLFLTRVTLEENGDGIITTNNTIINSSVIKNSARNAIVINSNRDSNFEIKNVIISGNKGIGISIIDQGTVNIKNVTIYNNDKGIIENSNRSQSIVSNSIIQENNEGIRFLSNNSRIEYSNVYNNKNGNLNIQNLLNSNNNLSVNSKFVSNQDLRLSIDSPLRDKGNINEKDTDGTIIDIGAYGGAHVLVYPNQPPRVLSNPPTFVYPGEMYKYEIKVEDPDGDKLFFLIMNNLPQWLSLNNNVLSGTPSIRDIGYYGVLVVISDQKGGNIVHTININVLPKEYVTPTSASTPTNNQQPSPSTTPTTVNTMPKLALISPVRNKYETDKKIEIKWEVEPKNINTIQSFEISYSLDGIKFTKIQEVSGNERSFIWDINNITPGKYFIRVIMKDKSNPNINVAVISDQFEIVPKNTEELVITKNSPGDNDVVKDKKIQIIVEFKPEINLDKSQTKLIVNGSEVAYGTTKNTIYYQPTNAYPTSKVTVEVVIVSTDGAKASKKWIFNIKEDVSPQDTTPDIIVQSQICIFGSSLCMPRTLGLIIIGILILIIVVLIMFFILKIIKTIRDQRQGNIENEFSDLYGNQGILSQYEEQNKTINANNNQDLNIDEYINKDSLSDSGNNNIQTVENELNPNQSNNLQYPTNTSLSNIQPKDDTNENTKEYQGNLLQEQEYINNLKNKYGINEPTNNSQFNLDNSNFISSNQEPFEGVKVQATSNIDTQSSNTYSQSNDNEKTINLYTNETSSEDQLKSNNFSNTNLGNEMYYYEYPQYNIQQNNQEIIQNDTDYQNQSQDNTSKYQQDDLTENSNKTNDYEIKPSNYIEQGDSNLLTQTTNSYQNSGINAQMQSSTNDQSSSSNQNNNQKSDEDYLQNLIKKYGTKDPYKNLDQNQIENFNKNKP